MNDVNKKSPHSFTCLSVLVSNFIGSKKSSVGKMGLTISLHVKWIFHTAKICISQQNDLSEKLHCNSHKWIDLLNHSTSLYHKTYIKNKKQDVYTEPADQSRANHEFMVMVMRKRV